MNNQHDFFIARAGEARRDAEAATLTNVRERCLRAAEAWDHMAARAARAERMRADEAERKSGMSGASTSVPAAAH